MAPQPAAAPVVGDHAPFTFVFVCSILVYLAPGPECRNGQDRMHSVNCFPCSAGGESSGCSIGRS
ncbi:hypothetical protein OH76DRAFT_1410109 [Lentinus brumalis]|uniref:Uncharacterized protein n=1 Tax=Lentinus brumalis TaxID=2498619 RepID=A0A371CT55_9APHY|nr:hypothetical protein OH76DRAFT_1410109 [Polyporus brumalis]